MTKVPQELVMTSGYVIVLTIGVGQNAFNVYLAGLVKIVMNVQLAGQVKIVISVTQAMMVIHIVRVSKQRDIIKKMS